MKYADWKNYLSLLAQKNKKVNHLVNGDKKFFEIDLEELISGTEELLPGFGNGAFIIFSGYIDRISFSATPKTTRELMFFVMQSAGETNFSVHAQTRTDCEEVVQQFISRFIKDSLEGFELTPGVEFWENGFDIAENITIIPNKMSIGSIDYLGWQVAISFTNQANFCFDQNNWNV